MANDSEPLMAEGIHQRDQVAGEGAGVVPVPRLIGEPDTALVDRDDLEVPSQRRHHEAPRVPVLGPAVDEQQRRPLASDDRVLAQLTVVDKPAGKRVRESGREIRRSGGGARALRGWCRGCTHEDLPFTGPDDPWW